MSDAVRSVLGLADDADDAAIAAAIVTLKATTKDDGEYVKLSDFKAVEERASELERKLHDQERDAFLLSMQHEGRLTPTETPIYQKLFDASPEATREALVTRKPVVTFTALGSGGYGQTEGPEVTILLDEKDLHRNAFQDAIETYLSEHPGVSYGDAMIAVEKKVMV